MALPVVPVKLPADLRNAQNGRLLDHLLVDVPFPGRPRGGRLHHQAYRGWEAISADCLRATGVVLTCTSTADAYRTFLIQHSTFVDRAYPVSRATYMMTASSRRRVYNFNGHTYWKFYDWASPVATPGSSNHGWGVSVDVCQLRGDGTIVHIAASPAWPWLKANLQRYGWSWEYSREGVEDWHVRLYMGDQIPSAVIDHETDNETSAWPPFLPGYCQYGLWPIAVKPRIGPLDQGDVVLYLQGVIRCKAGGRIAVHGYYDNETIERVKDLQRFFGKTVDGWCGPDEMWPLIDWLSQQPNNTGD